MTEMNQIASFVDKLRSITATTTDEREIIGQVRPLVRELCLHPDWVKDEYLTLDAETGFRVSTLHQEPDHTLAVFAVSWTPGKGVGPHDHGTWAVVGGIRGRECNGNWRRTDDGSRDGYAEIERFSEVTAGAGDVMCFRTGDIHSVENAGDGVALSLHVYGKHTNYTDRYQYNLETKKMERFILEEH